MASKTGDLGDTENDRKQTLRSLLDQWKTKHQDMSFAELADRYERILKQGKENGYGIYNELFTGKEPLTHKILAYFIIQIGNAESPLTYKRTDAEIGQFIDYIRNYQPEVRGELRRGAAPETVTAETQLRRVEPVTVTAVSFEEKEVLEKTGSSAKSVLAVIKMTLGIGARILYTATLKTLQFIGIIAPPEAAAAERSQPAQLIRYLNEVKMENGTVSLAPIDTDILKIAADNRNLRLVYIVPRTFINEDEAKFLEAKLLGVLKQLRTQEAYAPSLDNLGQIKVVSVSVAGKNENYRAQAARESNKFYRQATGRERDPRANHTVIFSDDEGFLNLTQAREGAFRVYDNASKKGLKQQRAAAMAVTELALKGPEKSLSYSNIIYVDTLSAYTTSLEHLRLSAKELEEAA